MIGSPIPATGIEILVSLAVLVPPYGQRFAPIKESRFAGKSFTNNFRENVGVGEAMSQAIETCGCRLEHALWTWRHLTATSQAQSACSQFSYMPVCSTRASQSSLRARQKRGSEKRVLAMGALLAGHEMRESLFFPEGFPKELGSLNFDQKR